MKIAKLICLIAMVAATSCKAQDPRLRQWSMALSVVDDLGLPVTNAQATVFHSVFTSPDEESRHERITGLTDINGFFSATGSNTVSSLLRLRAEKTGYYPVDVAYELANRLPHEKWNLNPTWTLKKIIKPIPMYAKWVNLGMPVLNEAVGFDLMAGDWVAPYGKGSNADILFTGHREQRSENGSDYKLVVSFPNPGDGIQEFSVPATRFPNHGSALRSSQEAPADGYQSQWIQTDSRKPGQPVQTNRDENRNYYFRVRTVLDEKGNVKSALYGKIYGDFMQFRYYLNPTPNDRSMEFDPKQNLLKGLKSFEQVDAP